MLLSIRCVCVVEAWVLIPCWPGSPTNTTNTIPAVTTTPAPAPPPQKSLVSAGLARRALVQLSYAIGVAEPTSVYVDTYGTGVQSNGKLLEIIKANFDLRPGVIVKELDLWKPIYQETAAYGHFGRDEFTWEHPKVLKF